VPAHFGVANALGAALARVTSEVTLQADTYRGTVVIPEADFTQKIDRAFDLQEARALAREILNRRALEIGADPETLEISVSEEQAFSMIRDSRKVGQNIRLKMSVIPGLIREWRN
jgi:hypothetical protein